MWEYSIARPTSPTYQAQRKRLREGGYERYMTDHRGEHYRRKKDDAPTARKAAPDTKHESKPKKEEDNG